MALPCWTWTKQYPALILPMLPMIDQQPVVVASSAGTSMAAHGRPPPWGQPSISYHDVTNNALKYAVLRGNTWTLLTVAVTGNLGLQSSLAFTPVGEPATGFSDSITGDLKFAVGKR